MTPEEIEKLKSDLAAETAAKLAAEAKLNEETKAKETAEALLSEQNAELDQKSNQPVEKGMFTHKKKQLRLTVPNFQGIPGYVGRKFTVKDCEENTVMVTRTFKEGKETKSEKLNLVDYLLKIETTIIVPIKK